MGTVLIVLVSGYVC